MQKAHDTPDAAAHEAAVKEVAAKEAAHEAAAREKEARAAASRQEKARAAIPAGPPIDPKVGDVVHVRLHDSPTMVVTFVSSNGLDVGCDWFDKTGQHHTKIFQKAMLVAV